MMKWRKLLSVTLLFLSAAGSSAQDLPETDFVHYTVNEGLSHNYVYAITQDSTGYIWIATANGLNRFDGTRFVQYHSNGDSLAPAAEEITGLNWLDRERVAMFTAGLHIINTRTGQVKNLLIPCKSRQYQYKFNMIEMVKGDKEGNLFVLSRSGFYQFDRNYRLVFRYDYYSDAETVTEHFFFGRELYELDDDRFLIVSIGGLYTYNKRTQVFKKLEAGELPELDEFLDYPFGMYGGYRFFQPAPGRLIIMKLESDSLVYVDFRRKIKTVSRMPFAQLHEQFHWRSRLIRESENDFYITGHYAGFFRLHFDEATGTWSMSPYKYFRRYLCMTLLPDREGNIWIGTSKGVFRQDPGLSRVQVNRIPEALEDTLPNIKLDDVLVTDDRIYVAGRGQAGLLIYDKASMQLLKRAVYNEPIGRGRTVNAIVRESPSTLLLGTDWPILRYHETTGKFTVVKPPVWGEGDWVSDMYKDSRGQIWINAFRNYRYDPVTGHFTALPSPEKLLSVPFGLSEDTEGNMWMAGHGIARYNVKKGEFDFVLDSFPTSKLPDKQVNAVLLGPDNTIWLNSNNNGLLAYNMVTKQFRHYTRSNGLPDDNLAALIIVGNRLWMAGYSGIACMDLRSGEILSFGKEDGFPTSPVMKGSRFFYDSSAQMLYLGFADALVRFNPYEVVKRRTASRVFFETIVVSGRTSYFLPIDKIETSWNSNDLMITIGSINFSSAGSQVFAYRILKNVETPWQQLGTQPSFNVSNLSPGTYRIQVKAYPLNNRWPPQVKEITVVVLPPFWQKDWFLILLFASIPALIYGLVKWRTGVARKKERQKTRIQKLLAENYKSQFELEQISNYFSTSLSSRKTEEEVLWDVAGNLIGRMNYEDCIIYLWNEDKTRMVQRAAYGPKGSPAVITDQFFDVKPGQGIVGHVMETRQPVLVGDTRKDPRYRVDDDFRLSEICVPIIHNDELLGVIDSEHHEANYFSDRDIQVLTTIATLLGNKLKQLESEKSLEEKRIELAGINEQLAEAQLAALQAQMNPHFVFNALNSIKRMILDGDNEKASRYLSKFALMIRMTLNHSKSIFVSLDENIEYLETYLQMEQLRFDESFTYRIMTGENIETSDVMVPSLMIQPIVENAIWHGLLPAEGEKRIQIGFSQRNNRVTCVIEDNGIGIRQSEENKRTQRPLHQSVGLENLQKRIKIMNDKYDMNCTLEIKDLKEADPPGRGTKVVLRFNIVNL